MQRFKSKTSKITLYLLTAQVAIIAISVALVHQFPPKLYIENKKRIATHNEVFLMGHSHMACAINDSLLSQRYTNIAQPAEPLFYTVSKARQILNVTKNDTIIIAFSHVSLNSAEWILNDDLAYQNYTKYFSKLEIPQHEFLWWEKPLKAAKTLLLLTPLQIYNSMRVLNGGYEPLYVKGISTKKEEKKASITSKYNPTEQMLGYKMLEETIKLYPSTYFILVRTPTHSTYVPDQNDSNFQICLEKLLKNKNCRFIDFKKTPIADSMFADPQHLNYQGALYFTPIFMDSIHNLSKKS